MAINARVNLWATVEAELRTYFEKIYLWHNCTGPLGRCSGFYMMEVFEFYLGFKRPWWNEVNANPKSKMPKTLRYLKNNVTSDGYTYCLNQIVCGLKKPCKGMIKMTTRYIPQTPIIFLLLRNEEHGALFLWSMLQVLCHNPVEDVILVFDDKPSLVR